MDAVDGVAHILLGGDDEAEGEHAGGGDAVVQPEDPVVDGRRASEASPHFFEVVIPEVVHCCRTPVSPGCDYLVLLINFWIQSETGMSPVT